MGNDNDPIDVDARLAEAIEHLDAGRLKQVADILEELAKLAGHKDRNRPRR
ncbi:MAG: hypothetical protein ACK5SX_15210 [Sandaracinobacter sp.]